MFFLNISINSSGYSSEFNGTWGIESEVLSDPATDLIAEFNGTWGIESEVLGESGETNMVLNFSGIWGIKSYTEYYVNTSWSGWWLMPYTGDAPTATNINPSDNSVNVATGNISISALFNDSNGDTMNISWYWSDNNTLIGVNNSVNNGTQSHYIDMKYNQMINWSINITDGINWNNYSLSMTGKTLNTVSDFKPSHYNSSVINLTWSKNSNISHTYIRFKKGDSPPNSRIDGVLVVNTTNSYYNHTGLDFGTNYSYSIWGYNDTDKAFSDSITGYNYTNPGSPSSLQDTDKTENSITLQWTKGNNATKSVIFVNDSGNSFYPDRDNGVEKINTTGNSGTASGLSNDTIYWFSIYSFNPVSGLWSEDNSTDNATTLDEAGAISNLVVSRYNHEQLNLSWSKGNPEDDTVIIRNPDNNPASISDGVEIYNGSGLSFKDDNNTLGLTPATKYYYRAWSWNGKSFGTGSSSDNNITRPMNPQDFVGDIDSGNLIMTWVKGEGAARTIIRNNTGSYPTLDTGSLRYNDTGVTNTSTGVGSIDFYRGWSYVEIDDIPVYSLGVNLVWGGLEINVYKEDEPWIGIGNYDIFITNNDGSETYDNTEQDNPFRIDVSDVPNGEGIIVQVSKIGFKTRIQTVDLFENSYYTLNFYLPPSDEGSPDSEKDEDWYNPPVEDEVNLQIITEAVVDFSTDETLTTECPIASILVVYVFNESIYGGWREIGNDNYSYSGYTVTVDKEVLDANSTVIKVEYYCDYSEGYSEHYIITVNDETGSSINDAYVVIKRFINDTANISGYDTWDTVLSDYSDSSGQVEADLIPDTVYLVNITKIGYIDMEDFWTPSEIVYVEDAYKTFVLYAEPTVYPDVSDVFEYISFYGTILGGTACVYYNDTGGYAENVSIVIYEINLSTYNMTVYNVSSITVDSWNTCLSVNNSNNYLVTLNLTYNSTKYNTSFYLNGSSAGGTVTTSKSEFESVFENVFGENVLTWAGLFGCMMLMLVLFSFGNQHAGVSILLSGFLFLAFNVVFNLVLISVSIGIFMVIVGILVQWRTEKRRKA